MNRAGMWWVGWTGGVYVVGDSHKQYTFCTHAQRHYAELATPADEALREHVRFFHQLRVRAFRLGGAGRWGWGVGSGSIVRTETQRFHGQTGRSAGGAAGVGERDAAARVTRGRVAILPGLARHVPAPRAAVVMCIVDRLAGLGCT